jgi:hypothetical protein
MGKGTLPDASGSAPRLCNLDAEIGERTNLAEQHPDIVQRLQALADRMSREIGGTHPIARRPPGLVANPKTLYPVERDAPRAKKAPGQPAVPGGNKPSGPAAGPGKA